MCASRHRWAQVGEAPSSRAANDGLEQARELGAWTADAEDREHLEAALDDLTAPY